MRWRPAAGANGSQGRWPRQWWLQYGIDASSGGLSPKTPATVATGSGPLGIAVSPDGRSAYVTNYFFSDNSVSQYDIDPVIGALSPKTRATVAAGVHPFGVAVTPDGKSAYVTNSPVVLSPPDDTVSQYDIDALSGALSPKTPATVPAGSMPRGIAIRPVARVPTGKQQCKNGGWRNFPQFKNQGDCVSFVEPGK